MNQSATIVSIISILACLFLVTQGLSARNIPMPKMIQLGLIWAVIILAVYILVRFLGLDFAR